MGTVRAEWAELVDRPAPQVAFDPGMVAALPAAAQRWLRHAIAAGTPLSGCVELDQHGQIKLGRWRTFTAAQVLAPLEGYIWAETTKLLGLRVRGYDRLTRGGGQMRHMVAGRVPIVTASGPDFDRSAAARLASEIAFVPGAALDPTVSWKPVDEHSAAAVIRHLGRTVEVTLTVSSSGALQRVTVPRWAKIGREPYREHPFAAVFSDEGSFGGYTIPTRSTAGYGYGTPDWPGTAFITQVIDTASYH